MPNAWIAFVCGMFIGVFLGIVIAALLCMAKETGVSETDQEQAKFLRGMHDGVEE